MTLALVTALAADNARAEDGSHAVASAPRAVTRVSLPCPLPADLAPLWQRLRVELAAEGVAWVDDPGQAPVVISLAIATCAAGPLEMTVTASRVDTGPRSRVISLRDASSPDRARTVALIVAEFVRTALQELAHDAATHAAPSDPASVTPPAIVNDPMGPGPMPSAAPMTAASPSGVGDGAFERRAGDPPRDSSLAMPSSDARSALSAEVVVRGYPAESTVLFGARLGASHPLGARWALRVAAMSAWGSHDAPIGSVAMWCGSGALGLDMILPAGPLRIEIGPELELGYARARGSAGRADVLAKSGHGVVLVTAVHARVIARLAPSWRWFLAAEAGQTLRGVAWKADERTAGGISGVQLGGAVGAMLAF